MDKKEQTKERVKRFRERRALRDSVTDVTQSPDSVTKDLESVTHDVTQYPAIIHMLVDPIKRRKLEKIHESLKQRNLLKLVTIGYPTMGGIPFDEVGDFLEATSE